MKTHVGIPSVSRRYHVGAGRAVRWGLVGFLLVLLAACAQGPAGSFRDQNATIAGTTRFDPQRFSGDWYIIAAFAEEGRSGPAGVLTYRYDPAAMTLRETGYRSAGYRIASPGVLAATPLGLPKLVVMWVDEGYRTAAIGTADGRFGAILDRRRRAGSDRVTAAKSIMKWYGWDLSRLQENET